MLKYNIRLSNTTDLVDEVKCDDIFLSPDLTYISGITSSDYGLVNGQPIFIREGDSSTYNEYTIQVYNCNQRGYVIFNQPYKIRRYDYRGKEVYGFVFGDNKKYIADEVSGGTVVINSINVYNEKDSGSTTYTVEDITSDNVGNSIVIPTKYYVYDSVVRIGGIDYNVDFYDEPPTITLKNGTVLEVQDYNITESGITKPNIESKAKFIIRKNFDYKVNVEHISFTKKFSYIESGTTFTQDYSGKRQNITANRLYLLTDRISGDTVNYYLVDRGKNRFKLNETSENPHYIYDTSISTNTITKVSVDEDGNEQTIVFELYDEWKNTIDGEQIHLYLDDSQYYFKEGDIIKATNTSVGLKELYVQEEKKDDGTSKKFISVNGEKYYVADDVLLYMVYDKKEYRIYEKQYSIDDEGTEASATTNYILIDGIPLLIELSNVDSDNPTAKRVIESSTMQDSFDENNTEYLVKKYQYVDINDDYYIVKTQTLVKLDTVYEYESIFYDMSEPILLAVNDVTSSNQLRCSLLNNYNHDTSPLSALVNSHDEYMFELENPLFDRGSVDNKPTSEKEYKDIQYRLYKSISNINIPLNLNNYNGTNLHQEYVTQNDFFNAEIEKSINRTVDMEKDIYYPAYYEDGKFKNVDAIRIDLHFRTRDLTDWRINNDIYGDANDSGNTTDSDYVGCNWNILDYYHYDSNSENASNVYKPYIDFSKYRYYQPSDLLYFLNFDDNDIFYQKDKVGKSFLRLSFYDGVDPRTQSLLATSTVFVNEGNLYNTFINNKIDKGSFISVDKVTDRKYRQLNKNIGVYFEPCSLDGTSADYNQINLTLPSEDAISAYTLTFEDDKRLSASFTIKNMFESTESSEGFYLYLFREYSSGIHERSIYLKVEFNHAGEGRTVTFTQPYRLEGVNRRMLDFGYKEDIALLKKGCLLQDMYENIYIEIKVKYDFETKKFYYYLPEWLTIHNEDKSIMRLNLYELKIADESLTTEN